MDRLGASPAHRSQCPQPPGQVSLLRRQPALSNPLIKLPLANHQRNHLSSQGTSSPHSHLAGCMGCFTNPRLPPGAERLSWPSLALWLSAPARHMQPFTLLALLRVPSATPSSRSAVSSGELSQSCSLSPSHTLKTPSSLHPDPHPHQPPGHLLLRAAPQAWHAPNRKHVLPSPPPPFKSPSSYSFPPNLNSCPKPRP